MSGGAASVSADEVTEVEDVVDQFLAAFTSGPECVARLDAVGELFLPHATIVTLRAEGPHEDDVESFIVPRLALLTEGALEDFREWRVEGSTEVRGDVAHWFGRYAKQGRQSGQRFEGGGTKSVQLVRVSGRWRISAVAWQDDPEPEVAG
ncbi:hypothetical protein [Nocardioides sp. Root140]|uniref:hypothetical protein n=1 Tax=Nocardioides sp. Root140 TaxID=1736460 RepID=UPI0006FD5497|nr:hypothetical protein [Nocardioides sp. Root140]KQY54404.1 hypothetical protein ASD30_17215 [Nocardioides sp. Root140]KRF19481.1 hypothetical protein ASH02_23175 [Nocardioides sp. Soil796]